MGDHAYAYRGQHSGYDSDDEEKVCRTDIYDVDGRQRTIIGCSPHEGERYVVETEVTERVRSPAIATDRYRYGSPPPPQRKSDYGSYGSYEKLRSPSSPSKYYDRRPPEVNDFINGVQVEASRTNQHTPPKNGATYGRPTVQPTPGYGGGGYGDYRMGNNYGGYSSDDYDSGEEDDRGPEYYKPNRNAVRPEPAVLIRPSPKTYGGVEPAVPIRPSPKTYGGVEPAVPIRPSPKTYGGVEPAVPIRPSPKNYGGVERRWSSPPPPGNGVGKLGKPTNNINEAIDYLKGAGKPYGSNYKTTESVKPYGTYGSDHLKSGESVKPYGTYGSDLKSGDSVKPYGTYGSDLKSGTTESTKPYGYGTDVRTTESVAKPYGTEPVKPYGAYGSDLKGGTEAGKPYNGTQYPVSGTTTTGQQVIDCYEAARRYNGKVIRT